MMYLTQDKMRHLSIKSLLLLLIITCQKNNLSEGNSTYLPRMTFTDKEIAFRRLRFHGHHTGILTVQEEQPDIVTAAGQRHLHSFDFQNHGKTVGRDVLWKECAGSGAISGACNYNITVLHKRNEANQLFLCGTNNEDTTCCNMNISEPSSPCTSSKDIVKIKSSIKEFSIKQGEPSVLIERGGHSELYITHSGAQDCVGIHKFGENRVEPASQRKEQQYVGLVLSRQRDDPLQDKLYAFYKEKNTDFGMDSDMWLPFVSQVCMADKGGSKSYRQFMWTSQLNARLYCGGRDRRQHYSELVDVAAAHADQWQHTRVYALFRNEWGMSAVCVYTIQDIEKIFRHSSFKGHSTKIPSPRPGTCVEDSTKLSFDVLKVVEDNSEMVDRVLPLNDTGPLLVSHHHYTHICIDSFYNKRNQSHTVLFLSLENGRIHKVMEDKSQAFFISEYRPFNHRAHIVSMVLHSSSRKLYVSSSSELVQLDVGSCAGYGARCEECNLARDPYCSWNGTHCSPDTQETETLQDVVEENHTECPEENAFEKVSTSLSVGGKKESMEHITVPLRAKYFLQCPMSSHHAEYTWHHPNNLTSCSPTEQQCLVLIDSMGPDQEGTYRCVSSEKGYNRTIALFHLQLDRSAAGQASSPLTWVYLMAVVLAQGTSVIAIQ
ncbi:semaphorin-7A [Myripristis murdjan]|uniref:semaphorin-7A n=1 Tax=Myripristis murdjan TaxID=586833 RepID=UPI001175D715|nr:semaphorin-7A-like [Myripristis murdjan]